MLLWGFQMLYPAYSILYTVCHVAFTAASLDSPCHHDIVLVVLLLQAARRALHSVFVIDGPQPNVRSITIQPPATRSVVPPLPLPVPPPPSRTAVETHVCIPVRVTGYCVYD